LFLKVRIIGCARAPVDTNYSNQFPQSSNIMLQRNTSCQVHIFISATQHFQGGKTANCLEDAGVKQAGLQGLPFSRHEADKTIPSLVRTTILQCVPIRIDKTVTAVVQASVFLLR
jgi:hypothetical protein